MEGVIVCPVQANPPVLYVNWTKDGNDLNLDSVSFALKACHTDEIVTHES